MKINNVHITVDVEEWFHTNWFDVPEVIKKHYGGIYPKSDVLRTTEKLIEMFNNYNAKATFFVLGETAKRYPEIMEILTASEHEIACHGWFHNEKYENIEDFKRDILRFKNEIYSDAKGFRFPNFSYSTEKFKILVKNGFNYDSSIVPCLKIPGWYGVPKAPIEPYDLDLGDEMFIKEFPMTVLPYFRLPGAGGWFLRNAGYQWTKNVVKWSLKKTGYGMIYIHPWEISDFNPDIRDIKFHVFRNTGYKTFKNLERLIETFSGNQFLTISDSLKLNNGNAMNAVKSIKWNDFVKNSDHSQVYHLYQWGTLLEKVHGHRLVYLQEDKGIFPLAYIKSLIFGNRLISLPFADYCGPCAQDEKTAEKLISDCEEVARELDVDFVEIRCPDNRYFEMFSRHGFVRRDDYFTFMLPLNKKIDELWRDVGKNRKKMIRKAEKNDVHIIEAMNKGDLKIFHQLYQRTMKKLGSPPQPCQFFDRMWDILYPQNLRIFLATYKGKHIAGKLFLLHKDVIYHVYGCSLREYLYLAPNDLLQWNIIKWGNENKFSHTSFGRAREEEGTVLFKKQWGSEFVEMPYFYKFYKKELKKRQEVQYKWISQLWSRFMPEVVANKIGPWLIKQIG
ncbi:MAG: GNAT family N-acetyltransferase [Methanobacteriaceae archaeon]|jgi:FemAB-related protein (PEP-CTERM system-associated)